MSEVNMATVFPDPHEVAYIECELLEVATYAKRQQRVLGTVDYPTKWDEAHEYLDSLLDDWRAAR